VLSFSFKTMYLWLCNGGSHTQRCVTKLFFRLLSIHVSIYYVYHSLTRTIIVNKRFSQMFRWFLNEWHKFYVRYISYCHIGIFKGSRTVSALEYLRRNFYYHDDININGFCKMRVCQISLFFIFFMLSISHAISHTVCWNRIYDSLDIECILQCWF